MCKEIFIFLAILFVASCGGGGGGESKSSTTGPTNQTIRFSLEGPVELSLGQAFINVATGEGNGEVTYNSSDSSVATVGNTGALTLLAPGTVTITAAIKADSQFLAAEASYVVNVNVDFTAWIGANNTLVNFPAAASGLEFYRSSELDCDLDSYTACTDGQLDFLTSTSVIDTAATLNRTGYYALKHEEKTSLVSISTNIFSERVDHQVTAFNNQLWVIGGYDGDRNNDVWSSQDGVNWVKNTPVNSDGGAIFTERFGHQLTVYDNKLWLVGGSGIGYYNDVWSSLDGVTWTEQTSNAAFSKRYNHQLVTFDNKLWVIGGGGFSSELNNDTWSSSDGISWTQETASAAFTARSEHQVVVYQNELWLIGGRDSGGRKSDVWSSINGIDWIQSLANAPFGSRSGVRVTVFDGQIFLIGGLDDSINGFRNDVWSSTNGFDWVQVTGNAEFPGRYVHQISSFKNQLWIIAGSSSGYSFKNDVWSSSDGISWAKRSNSPAFSPRDYHRAIVFNGQLWIIGGRDDEYSNDVLSSSDGINWKVETDTAAFSPRVGHQLAVYNNRLWVIGGSDDTGIGDRNDIWSSINGVSWTEETSNAEFSPRSGHEVAVYRNQLWLIGGSDEGYKNDIWSSSDGVTWTERNPSAPFSKRLLHQVVVHRDKLWLIGGVEQHRLGAFNSGSTGGRTNDVWSSVDGIPWVEVTSAADFPERYFHQSVSFQDKLWVIGGFDDFTTANNDIWSSIDGVTWTENTSSAEFSERFGHQVVNYNNNLVLIGGYFAAKESRHNRQNDVWLSTDGLGWRKGYRGIFQFD